MVPAPPAPPAPAARPALLETLTLREVTMRNRIGVSPMCQYSCVDGLATDWHLVHLGSRAVGGAGLVMAEATAVTPEGRISPGDLGIWGDAHVAPLAKVAAFVRAQGAVAGIQIAHAGRKASTAAPWEGGHPLGSDAGGWDPVAASALPFAPGHLVPGELDEAGIGAVVDAFAAAARRAHEAGFQVVEVHAAHGYLLHGFLSPLANRRTDGYGGSFAGRARLLLEVVAAVRGSWPEGKPLFVRLSATDWVEGGWDLEQSVRLARELRGLGVDLVDVSSGGAVPGARIQVGPGYQVPFAQRIRAEAGIATAAVGMVTGAMQAESIVRDGQADMVMLARAMLRDPYWALRAEGELGSPASWPRQYERAMPKPAKPA